MNKKWQEMTLSYSLKVFALSVFMLSFKMGALMAHPWGGLVIDNRGNIYFTFINPIVDKNHLACVRQINNELDLISVLESNYSPVILSFPALQIVISMALRESMLVLNFNPNFGK